MRALIELLLDQDDILQTLEKSKLSDSLYHDIGVRDPQSILASASVPRMRERLNKIKGREDHRSDLVEYVLTRGLDGFVVDGRFYRTRSRRTPYSRGFVASRTRTASTRRRSPGASGASASMRPAVDGTASHHAARARAT